VLDTTQLKFAMVLLTNYNHNIALLFLCLGLLPLQEAANVAIFPSPSSSSCPVNEECYSLSQLYENSSNQFPIVSDTTLKFFNLQYKFESTILIRDVDNIKVVCTSAPTFLCQLHCNGSGSFVFMNITNLWFNGFILYDCGSVIRKDLGYEATRTQVQLYHTFEFGLKAAIFAVNVKNLIANWNVVNGSYGYSILGINIIGRSSFNGLLIGFSNFRSFNEHCLQRNPPPPLLESVKCQGGSALFHYSDLPYCPESVERHSLTLKQTQIVKGFDPVGGNYGEQFIVHGSGLGIIMAQTYFDVDVYVLGANIGSNNALASSYGGSNLYLRFLGKVLYSTITIRDSYIASGNRACIDRGFLKNFTCDYSYYSGAAVAFIHGEFSNFTPNECSPVEYKSRLIKEGTTFLIENSVLDQNLGGGFHIFISPGLIKEDKIYNTRNIAIRDSRIVGSVCGSNYACSMRAYQLQRYGNQIKYDLIVQNTTFADNKFLSNVIVTPSDELVNAYRNFGNIIIVAFENSTFINCSFLKNQAPSLLVYYSQMYFEGTNTFDSNTALFGGAFYLERNSFIFLRPNTTMLFRNNVATRNGGAIYIVGDNDINFHMCPIQIYDPLLTKPSKLGVVMKFVNNTALGSGDALYGGQIDRCFSTSISGFVSHYNIVRGSIVFDNITDFSKQPPSDSLISSDALQVCLCNKNKPICSERTAEIKHHPGERFQISVIVLGQRGGTVSAVVFTTIMRESSFDRNYQVTNRTCSNATYTLASSQPYVLLSITTEDTVSVVFNSNSSINSSISKLFPIIVQVNMIPCGDLTGFMLDESSEICDCAQPLRDRNMTCDIDTKIITRLPPYWLSNYSNHLLLHDNCPYDYCKPIVVPIIMIKPNISDQCAFSRQGILCGSCQDGLSQVFGTSQCLKCSNIYVLYIFLFAAAGIMLVVLLLMFNLTVSKGAINGLIFYANIVKINESFLFPPGDVSPFKVFISWLNLDLGIETCFYNGMDSAGKTWLQFLFPLYLWLILAAIIVACRYSITMARLVGNHAVEVLATTFLLSYTKLLRTIITVFSSTTLVYPEGQRAVWLYDGNYQFGRGGHLALFLFSLLIFVLIALPYTLLIVSVQFLRRYSHLYPLKWVTKLMPIFDAYLGPYKHKHGYWTGLLFLVRVLLVVVFAINILGNPAINLFIIHSTAFVIIILNLGLGGVYKSKLLTALEIFYVGNLLAVASATSLTREGSWNQKYAIYFSISLAMLAFFSTIAYQAVRHIKEKINEFQVQRKGCVLQNTNSDLRIGILESTIEEGATQMKQKVVLVTETVIDGTPEIVRHCNTA
jgi:predicted outer membrane repeat protein